MRSSLRTFIWIISIFAGAFAIVTNAQPQNLTQSEIQNLLTVYGQPETPPTPSQNHFLNLLLGQEPSSLQNFLTIMGNAPLDPSQNSAALHILRHLSHPRKTLGMSLLRYQGHWHPKDLQAFFIRGATIVLQWMREDRPIKQANSAVVLALVNCLKVTIPKPCLAFGLPVV